MFRAHSRQPLPPSLQLVALLATAFGAASGCAALFGMDEGTCIDCAPAMGMLPEQPDPSSRSADAGAAPPDPCETYCDGMASTCNSPDTVPSRPYKDRESCLVVCRNLPPGDPDDTSGNSLSCRLNLLQSSEARSEPVLVCAGAGRGGQAREMAVCGSNCEAYCSLMQSFCRQQVADFDSDCPTTCQGVADRLEFDADLDEFGDTIQCRLWHVSVAAGCRDEDDSCRTRHCGHAAGANPCVPR